MSFARIVPLVLCFLFVPAALAQTSQPDWTKIEEETLRHFQAILRIYNVVMLPTMLMAQLRAKGMQCYGIRPRQIAKTARKVMARTAIRNVCWKKRFISSFASI
ncbi:MAG: hypothetical protein JST84_18360 [Acidobacteria bacterium]|nr:hypothetical protein [Acidobacteriota bacterium]